MTSAVSPVTPTPPSASSRRGSSGRFYLDPPPQPLLWEKFGLYGRIGHVYDVKLHESRISVVREDSSGSTALEVHIVDIVGCQLMKCKDPNDPSAYFVVYAYPEKKVFGQPKRRERQTLTFAVNRFVYFDLNLEIANKWKAAILKLKSNRDNQPVDPAEFSALSPRPRPSCAGRCLVLLNPFGGKGKALTSFTEQVAPVLSEAELQYNMIVTERPGHAQELIQSIVLEEWTCVLICSGDGLIYEVINGLMRRFDWRRAIQIPIGVIPCGTGNALAASILWRSGESLKSAALVPSSAFIVTQQMASPLDLILVETRASRFYSFLSVCYGLIADVDIESEKYRKLGVVRNILGGLVRILDLRTYRCRISYLPSTTGGGRVRAESSGDQKRRHVSDSVLKTSFSRHGDRDDVHSNRNWIGRRSSTTEAEKMLSASRQRRLEDNTTSRSVPSDAIASDPIPRHPSTPSGTPSSPNLKPGSFVPSSSSSPAQLENPEVASGPLFKHSMSVPNGFGVCFDRDVKETSPSTPTSPPTLGNNNSSNIINSAHLPRKTVTVNVLQSPTSPPDWRLNRSSDSSSGYGSTSSSSESPPDVKASGVLPGLEPIVEDETELGMEESIEEEMAGEARPIFSAGEIQEEDDEDNDDDDVTNVNKVVIDNVIYDVPVTSKLTKDERQLQLQQHQQLPDSRQPSQLHEAGEFKSKEEDETTTATTTEDDYERIDLTPTRLSKIEEEVPSHWITMETEIVSANVINISHLSSETIAYTGADINDGRIFIYVIRAGISKAGLLQMLSSMDSADAPVDHPFVDIIPCDAFRLEPLVEGILTVDGEVIPCSTIQGEVLPGIARVLVGKDKTPR